MVHLAAAVLELVQSAGCWVCSPIFGLVTAELEIKNEESGFSGVCNHNNKSECAGDSPPPWKRSEFHHELFPRGHIGESS